MEKNGISDSAGGLIRLYMIAFVLFVSAVSVEPAHASDTLVFSTFENSGLTLVEEPILRELYRRIGFEIEILQYPGERALMMANEGKVDGEVARIDVIKKKCRNLVMIPVPLHHLKLVVFSKNFRFPVRGYESLKPYRVVTLRGYKYFEEKLEEYGIRYHLVDTFRQILLTLDAQRHDIALFTLLDGLKTLSDLGHPNITYLEPPLETIPIYHFIHRKHEHLVPLITTTLDELVEAGVPGKIEKEVINRLVWGGRYPVR